MPAARTGLRPPYATGSLDPSTSAENLLSLGIAYAERQDWDRSAACLEQVTHLAQTQNHALVLCRAAALLGLLRLEQGRPSEALEWFGRAHTAAGRHDSASDLALVSTLADIGRARMEAEERLHELDRHQAQLAERVRRLQEETRSIAAQLRRELAGVLPATSQAAGLTSGVQASRPAMGDPQVTVRLLGRFEARLHGGEALELCSSRKGQALFKVLATQPHVRQPRDALLLSFWPDESPATAVGKLHIAASRLRIALARAGLGAEALLFEEDGYVLNSALRFESDVVGFDAHFRAGQRLDQMREPELAAAEFEAALALYGGPYLADTVGADWPLAERARLENQYLSALGRLAAGYFDRGQHAQGVECCRRVLAVDPLREDICRLCMRCLCGLGQRSQALQLYQACAHCLHQELAVEPMRETRELAQRIRDEQAI